MFDMGFWEVTLIFIVLLLVVGPERLPGLTRKAGLWIGKARRMVSTVKAEVERELEVSELKQSLQKQTHVEDFKRLADQVKSINADIQTLDDSVDLKKPSEAVKLAKTDAPDPSVKPSVK